LKNLIKYLFKSFNLIVIFYMQLQLKYLRKQQDTPYFYIMGTGKEYPKYLMFTDDIAIRNKLHAIE
jgi:hypothetical protein